MHTSLLGQKTVINSWLDSRHQLIRVITSKRPLSIDGTCGNRRAIIVRPYSHFEVIARSINSERGLGVRIATKLANCYV